MSSEKIFSDSYGHPIFTATMSKKRLYKKRLYQRISFDDYSTRIERCEADCFAVIQKVFQLFNQNCGRALIPDDLLAFGETLYPMRNREAIQPKQTGQMWTPFQIYNRCKISLFFSFSSMLWKT